MSKKDLDIALQKSSEFIRSLQFILEASGNVKFDFFFSIKDEGTLFLDGDDLAWYRECLRLLVDAIDGEIISPKAVEQLYQKTILDVLDIFGKRKEETFDKRLETGLRKLRESLLRPLLNFQVYYPINGLRLDGLPMKVGNVVFSLFDEDQLLEISDVLGKTESEFVRKERNIIFLDHIKQSGIIGGVVGIVDVRAIDSGAAKALALNELSITLDIINFYSDLIPYQKGHLFIPGQRERTKLNVITLTQGDEPNVTFGSEVVGPLVPLSFPELLDVEVKKGLGFLRASKLLLGKRNLFEERLISALQWAGRATIEGRKEDAFLSYAISLESLILSDNEREELNYRLKTRIAHLLGKGVQERIEISKKVGDLYAIRSKIVHSGYYQVTDGDIGLMRHITKMCILRVLNDEPFSTMNSINDLTQWFNEQILG